MTDLRTVTFDASQWQLVPKVPTEEMLDAASHASMQHLIDCINDPEKLKEIGNEENVRKTHASRYKSMLAAAPTPAAQSAGQEAIYLVNLSGSSTPPIRWVEATEEAFHTFTEQNRRVVYAAPVNGGEREQVDAEAYRLAKQVAQEIGFSTIGEALIALRKYRAADVQQVGGDEREAFKTWKRTVPPCHAEELVFLRQGFSAGWELGRAALSADGGEDKRDAERYRTWRKGATSSECAFQEFIYRRSGDGVVPVTGGMLDAWLDEYAAVAANQSGKGGE